MGFKGWTDVSGDCATVQPTDTVGCAQQNEFRVVPGSLLGKANVAQAVFDNKFLLPFAPESPEFFLVPGDNQVTVLWRPSVSEQTGDPFFQVAKQPTVIDPVTNSVVANPLYDPNYREFDVEGYRIYRGRVDAPNALTLLAQFDYAGTSMADFAGQINPVLNCAPELNIFGPPATACPFDNPFPTPGTLTQARTLSVDVPLTGAIVQVALGQRSTLATTPATAIILASDTALTGGGAEPLPGAQGHGRAVRLRGQDGPEQLPVLLLGDGVRRELDPVGSDEPRVAPPHQVGHPERRRVQLREFGGHGQQGLRP